MERMYSGKTLDIAKSQAFKEFSAKGIDENDIDFEILEQPVKKFFGIKGEFKIKAIYNEEEDLDSPYATLTFESSKTKMSEEISMLVEKEDFDQLPIKKPVPAPPAAPAVNRNSTLAPRNNVPKTASAGNSAPGKSAPPRVSPAPPRTPNQGAPERAVHAPIAPKPGNSVPQRPAPTPNVAKNPSEGVTRNNVQPQKPKSAVQPAPQRIPPKAAVPAPKAVPQKPASNAPKSRPAPAARPAPQKNIPPRVVALQEENVISNFKDVNTPSVMEDGTPIVFTVESKKVIAAKDYLQKVISALGVQDFSMDIKCDGDVVVIDIVGEKLGAVIGRRGETLDSLQYLAILVGNKIDEPYCRLSVDCNGYREKRFAALEALALKMTARVLKYGKSVALEPMNPYERRIIHNKVSEVTGVCSHSQGDDPNRKVIISIAGKRPFNPANKPKNSAPIVPAEKASS